MSADEIAPLIGFFGTFVGRIRVFENQIEVGRIALLDALNTWQRRKATD